MGNFPVQCIVHIVHTPRMTTNRFRLNYSETFADVLTKALKLYVLTSEIGNNNVNSADTPALRKCHGNFELEGNLTYVYVQFSFNCAALHCSGYLKHLNFKVPS